jgi:predicted ester cyclase
MSLDLIIYEQIWIDGLNRGDVSPADESFAAHCKIHMAGAPDPSLSVADFKELVKGLLATFPDLHIIIKDQIISGDKVAFRWVAEGTHSGPLGEAEPTGKQARFEGLIIDHVVDGQVVERWEQWDQMGMLQQLGLV